MATALLDKAFPGVRPPFPRASFKSVIQNQTLDDALIDAIRAYDYPPITYDFFDGHERVFTSIADLECFLKDLLLWRCTLFEGRLIGNSFLEILSRQL